MSVHSVLVLRSMQVALLNDEEKSWSRKNMKRAEFSLDLEIAKSESCG